jgi:hypothetical protein
MAVNSKRHFIELGDPIYDEISKKIRQSYPNACICWIESNDNPFLKEKYDLRKSNLKITNEQELFHGSDIHSIDSICELGFDPTLNRTSAYGKGTYFAKHASYSKEYMKQTKMGLKFMIISDVIVGNPCLGSANLIINKNLYDSAVNSLTDPTIFVIPHIDGAYPKYIISFHTGDTVI